MRARWLVAKYMSDLRRREPINVGVILEADERRLCRFLGQRDDGLIDGRRLKLLGSVKNYKDWVAFWRHSIATCARGQLAAAVIAGERSDSNFFVEVGGERLIGGEVDQPEDLLEDLFSVLVEDVAPSVNRNITQLCEAVFSRLAIADRVVRSYRVEQAHDSIVFDYRFDNGLANLMQGVSLALPDDRSWQTAHAAAWAFQRAGEPTRQMIALVRPREKDEALNRQIQLLGSVAKVIDVSDAALAAEALAPLLHM